MTNKQNSQSLFMSALTISSALILINGCSETTEQQANRNQAIPVKLQTLQSATLINSSEYVGTLEAQNRVSLAPRINGRISEIFVSQGDYLRRGELIVRLEPTQAQENVNAATQNVNSEKARLRQAQAELRTAKSNRAAALAETERARANLEDLEAQVELAQINIERTKMLVREGVFPQQNLDNDNHDLKTSIAQRNARKESLNAAIKSLQALDRQIEQVQASIDSQQAAVKRAEAELGAISQNLAFNTIKAPIDGMIGSFDQKVGDYVNAGEQLTTITNNKNLELNINIPIEYRSQLRKGLSVETINDDGSPGIRGEITYIAPLVQQSTQSILTKVTFPNQSRLRDREYVRARVIWSEKPGLLVPTTAISTLGGQNFIYLAQENNSQSANNLPSSEISLIARQQPIQLGSIQSQDYQVISGVKEGDRVAVSNILSLRDGIPIQSAETGQQIGSLE